MKTKINYLVYPLAIFAMGMFIIAGCSDDEAEVLPDDDNGEAGTVADIDGNVYQTVIIGDQEWLAENLRVTRYNNEDAIPTGLSNAEWENTTEGAYAIYPHEGGETEDDVDGINSDLEMVEAYGKLYNWYAVDDDRGLCPEGWSVPSNVEWTTLVDYIVSKGYPNEFHNPNGAGNALKSCRQVDSPLGDDCDTKDHPRWDSHSTHSGFDAFGFSALPGGERYINGCYYDVGYFGGWWASGEGGLLANYFLFIAGDYGIALPDGYYYENGFSVRCFRKVEN